MASKLTQRDRNNIILRFKRNEKINDLAKRYEVSRQTISHLIHEYQETGSIPQEKKAGRKRVELSESEKELIRNSLNECHMKADRLEVYIRKKTGRRISHNKMALRHLVGKTDTLISIPLHHINRVWIRLQ